MLQDLSVLSNFEVIIMFPGKFVIVIDPWVNDEYLLYIKILLLQLKYLVYDKYDLYDPSKTSLNLTT